MSTRCALVSSIQKNPVVAEKNEKCGKIELDLMHLHSPISA